MSKTLLHKAAAIGTAVFAAAGLVFSISSVSFASADGSIGSSATVVTVPQCTWQISGASETISLDHSEYSADGHTKYVGQDFGLSGTGSNTVKVFVGSSSATSASNDADNCSWYGSTDSASSGASVGYSVPSSPGFTSTSTSHSDDHSLSFSLDGDATTGSHTKQLTVALTKTGCTDSVATGTGADWSGDSSANLKSTTTSFTAAELAASKTTTSSSCSWTTKLTTFVPGGITPSNSADTYTFTGPTITTTLTASGIGG
jgi:hypothetical protein